MVRVHLKALFRTALPSPMPSPFKACPCTVLWDRRAITHRALQVSGSLLYWALLGRRQSPATHSCHTHMAQHLYKSCFFYTSPLEGLTSRGLTHKTRTMTYLVKVWGKNEVRI